MQGGDNYAPNQTITILGTSLGGASPTNDLVLTITDVDNDSTLVAGPILTMNASGTAQRSTTGYVVADRIKIPGSNFPSGVNNTNDVIMRVDSVGTGGYITGVTVSGTAPDGTATYNAVAASGGAGSSATLNFSEITRGPNNELVSNESSTNFYLPDMIDSTAVDERIFELSRYRK